MLLPFHAMPATDVLKSFESSSSGLSLSEAVRRLEDSSSWEAAPPKSKGILVLLWKQIANPFVALLLGAIGVSVWTGEWLDAGVTLAIVLVNIALGFFQEFHADREFFALQNYLPKEVTVRRDGKVITISSNLLVPGDIAIFNAGKNIVCDGRILSATECLISESALSGESAPVAKNAELCAANVEMFERTNMVFAGTSMVSGQATVLITALGTQTEFGKIETLTTTTRDHATPLEEEMAKLSAFLTKGILVLAIIILIVAMIRGESAITALALAAALAIAAIPEGLSMTLTVVLSVAMRRMFRKGVLVRHLTATETLGCINVLCADKTGTLTTGEMSIVEVRSLDGVVRRAQSWVTTSETRFPVLRKSTPSPVKNRSLDLQHLPQFISSSKREEEYCPHHPPLIFPLTHPTNFPPASLRARRKLSISSAPQNRSLRDRSLTMKNEYVSIKLCSTWHPAA